MTITGDIIPLSPIEIAYEAIQSTSVVVSDTSDPMSHVLDEYSHSSWLISMESPDPFDDTFPTDESILEVMSLEETPWDIVIIIPLSSLSLRLLRLILTLLSYLRYLQILIMMFYLKGIWETYPSTIPIDISVKLGIMENIHIGDLVLLMKYKLTQPYSNNYRYIFLVLQRNAWN
jgi:hypothetical protein